ncbi:MAG: O-antigen ligase family protein [Bryobacterales bacterium]|nr:O-antigen ligase family protein [Bryobacterales bacterium]
MTARFYPNAGSGEVVPIGSSRAFGLLVLLTLIVIPTGFDSQYLPWFCVELAGTGLLIGLWWKGEPAFALHAWRAAGALSVWLSLSMVLAAIQILLGTTESRFDTVRHLHFFAGGLLLIPLVASAYPALTATASQKWTPVAASAFLLVSLISGSLGLLQSNSAEGTVAWWPFIYRNHFAAFAVLVLPVLCWRAFLGPTPHWGAAAGVVVGIAGVVSSASRSGIVLLAITLGAFCVLAWLRSRGERKLVPMAAILLTVLLGAALADSGVLSWRMQHNASLLEGREDYWQASLRMIRERPLLGWGFGTWPDVYPQFQTNDTGVPVNHAHSDWLELTAEGGVISAFALAVLFARSLWLAGRNPGLLGVPAFLILAMVDYPLRLPLLLFSLVSVLATAELLQRREAP